MEYKLNSEKPAKLEKGLEKKSCEGIVTAETMLMEYPCLAKAEDVYNHGNFSNFPNFSNWSNWPHSR